MQRNLEASIARVVRNRHRNCFYQRRYRETSTFPRTRNDDGSFSTEKSVCRTDTALSRKETEREFVSLTSLLLRKHDVFSHFRERDKRSFRDERSLGTALPCRTPTFTGRRAYVSADAVDDGSHG